MSDPSPITDQPRRHAYLFAHLALRDAALQHGPRLLRLAVRDLLTDSLTALWEDIGSGLEPAERLPATGLDCEYLETEQHWLALVTPPPARHITEAHRIAVAVPRAEEPTRYLLLEHGVSIDQGPLTVLGEWTESGHHNLGAGPEPEAFLPVVLAHLEVGPVR